MKLVVLDGYTENPGDLSWDALGQLGDLTVYDRTSFTDEGEIISRIGEAEVVFTNKTPISRAVIDACPRMGLISVLATGYNVVDCAYAGERGIPVSVFHRPAAGNLSPYRPSRRLGPRGPLGTEPGLVLLGLPPD